MGNFGEFVAESFKESFYVLNSLINCLLYFILCFQFSHYDIVNLQ